MFFGATSLVLALLSIGLATPVVIEFLQTGLVPKLPTAVLSVGIMIVAVLSMMCGLILDTVTHSRRELKRLAYLEIRAPKWPARRTGIARNEVMHTPSGGLVAFPSRAPNDPGKARLPQTSAAVS